MSTEVVNIHEHDYEIPDFPEVWDSTIRASFANCMRKGYWEFIRNLRKSESNIDLLFGSAFAKAMEVARKSYYVHGRPAYAAQIDGIIAATNIWERENGDEVVPHKGDAANKTYAGLVDAIDSYFQRWPLDTDELRPLALPNGELFIEKTFAFPIDGTAHPRTGKPIIYGGRLDMLSVWKDADLCIGVDEKTTTRLGDSWSNRWLLRAQFTGYCKGAEIYGYRVRHFHIRGIGIMKNDIAFAENIQTRKPWQIDSWLSQTRRDINRAIRTYQRMCLEPELGLHTYWDQNLDAVCTLYNKPCSYIDLCASEKPERWIHNYDDVVWNPLADRE
jgi:hypothetical protein